jgi:hypothetical protein
LLERFQQQGLPVPEIVAQADYFDRAYHEGAGEDEL